ncbi:fasciclin domain-containing protein [uncultured Amaricoccus sp.]|uniref:fasciclin domain-containing protein n=1 Tax=uncultured Amaricoccus sp. TaxID=339341 RepID=UPI002629D5BD|nr:fasciclin domain-containing protein [uncultured Amaricoccus sp.]
MTEPRTMRARTGFAPLLLAALLLGGCGGGGEAPSGGSGPDVLAVSRANGLDAFVAAVDTAGMTETLSGPGPYTVFAPTDRAMAGKRPRTEAEARALVAALVVPGTFTTDFLGGVDLNYTTLANRPVNIDGTDGLRFGGVPVTRADLIADNGVVHVIGQLP